MQHPTAMGFLDETGTISSDRFFAVGFLKLVEPSVLARKIQKLRDQRQWYKEIHFTEVVKTSLPFYKRVVELIAGTADCYEGKRSR